VVSGVEACRRKEGTSINIIEKGTYTLLKHIMEHTHTHTHRVLTKTTRTDGRMQPCMLQYVGVAYEHSHTDTNKHERNKHIDVRL